MREHYPGDPLTAIYDVAAALDSDTPPTVVCLVVPAEEESAVVRAIQAGAEHRVAVALAELIRMILEER